MSVLKKIKQDVVREGDGDEGAISHEVTRRVLPVEVTSELRETFECSLRPQFVAFTRKSKNRKEVCKIFFYLSAFIWFGSH